MKLNRLDVIEFVSKDGKTQRGTALRYDPRDGVIVTLVYGRPFRWEGGPLEGKMGHSDSLWAVPYADIRGVTPAAAGPR